MACLRAVSRRTNLLPRQFWMLERPVLHVNKDDTRTDYLNSSPLTCGLHSQARRHDCSLEERKHMSFARTLGSGFLLCRHMSSKPEECSNKIDWNSTVVEELVPEESLEAVISQVSSVKEVAIAAADSSLPVAAIQHFIDSVHAFTGFNWCLSIVLSTFLVGGLYIPAHVKRLNAGPDFANTFQHAVKMIQTDLVKFKREWLLIFDDLKPGLSLLIATAADWFIYISTFLAIRNMAQKMPSFESGGILWFTDLTTPDSFYVLPAVLGVTFWFTTMSDDSYQRQQKPGFEAFSLLCWIFTTVAFQAIFSIESAVFCFMISSNIIGYGLDMATKSPKVRKLLKIRNLPDGSPDGVTLSEVLEISQRIQSASKAPNATKKELLKNAERIQSPKKIRNAAKKKGKNKKR